MKFTGVRIPNSHLCSVIHHLWLRDINKKQKIDVGASTTNIENLGLIIENSDLRGYGTLGSSKWLFGTSIGP